MIYNKIKYLKILSINFGPQHPAAHGVLRLIIELVGERVLYCDPHIGLLHRGTEKLIEHKSFLKALPYFSRLDYVSLMVQEHAFSLATERLLNIEVPNKAKLLRILFSEISRILNHIMSLTTHALDVGALSPFLFGFIFREILMEIYEGVCGTRMHAAFIRPGGVSKEIPFFYKEVLRKFCWNFEVFLYEMHLILNKNRIWRQRLIGVGLISNIEALSFSFTGVMLRSTGIKWDIRKNNSYELYNEINFVVPYSRNGDSYDRYLLRIYESLASTWIIKLIYKKCFEQGSIKVSNFKIVSPSRLQIKKTMEGLIRHFKFFSEGIVVKKNECYIGIEAPKGEFGVYLVSNNSTMPYRCKIRAPGFFHLQCINFLSKGHLIADVVTIIGSLDVVFGEIDR